MSTNPVATPSPDPSVPVRESAAGERPGAARPMLRLPRALRSAALFSAGVMITLACTRVKVTWDQPASAAAPGTPAAVAPALPPPSAAQVNEARSFSRTFSQVAEQVSPAVVSITMEKKQKVPAGLRRFGGRDLPFFFRGPGGPGGPFGEGEDNDDEQEGSGPVQRGAGSGVVIDGDGRILTNNHVVGGADKIKVRFADGKELVASIVGTDPRSDLAVIKVDTKGYKVHPAKLGDSGKLLVGEWVMAIGNPFGLDHTVTVGVISAKGRSRVSDSRNYQDFLQTDASINPGNSGGPLINLSGEVIGINTAILGPGANIGIGFAVPSDLARPIVRDLVANGKVRRPFLGIMMAEITPELQRAMHGPEKGALVQNVNPGAPAAKAGIKRGDVIVKVDGVPIEGSRDVQKQVLTHGIGDTINLEIWRDGRTMSLPAKAAELPGDDETPGSGGEERGKAKSKLGLSLQGLTPQLAERMNLRGGEGVLINGVKPGSPAAEAGLNRGDVILEIDRRPVRSVDEAVQTLAAERQGGHLLLVQRGDQSYYVALNPGGK